MRGTRGIGAWHVARALALSEEPQPLDWRICRSRGTYDGVSRGPAIRAGPGTDPPADAGVSQL